MTKYDVVGLGNALLDLTISVDESFLESINLTKGTMTLINEDRYKDILAKISYLPTEKTSGGSAANTIKGVSLLGGKSAFIGMVGHDEYGRKYEKELNRFNIKTSLAKEDKNTGTAITFITKDGERTFATYLGVASDLTEKNIDEELIKESKIFHVEGYFLWSPETEKAVLKCMKIAKENHRKISIDLSDPGLIRAKFDTIKEILTHYANIVFVNEHEAKAFTGVEEEDAAKILSEYCETSIVKLGASGSIIKHKGQDYKIPIHKVEVVNTNGAGDSYAAGILYSIAHNIPMDKAGKIASYISSRVVSIPEATLSHSIENEVKRIVEE